MQPAYKEDGWDTEPFEPVVEDGKIKGRGSTDDKGEIRFGDGGTHPAGRQRVVSHSSLQAPSSAG